MLESDLYILFAEFDISCAFAMGPRRAESHQRATGDHSVQKSAGYYKAKPPRTATTKAMANGTRWMSEMVL
ncbi:hypothetical protein BST61_g9898 [Cercospora zeina]